MLHEKSEEVHTTLEEWQEFRAHRNPKLENRIVRQNQRLVLQQITCTKLSIKESQLDGALTGGYMGLVLAVRRFDPDTANAFSSFAVPYIRFTALRMVQRYGHSVSIPRSWNERLSQARTMKKFKERELRKIYIERGLDEKSIQLSEEQIAASIGVTLSELEEMQEAWGNREACRMPRDDEDNEIELPDMRDEDDDDEIELTHKELVQSIERSPLPTIAKSVLNYGLAHRFNFKGIRQRESITQEQAEEISREAIAALELIKQDKPFERVLIVTQQVSTSNGCSNAITPSRLQRIRHIAALA